MSREAGSFPILELTNPRSTSLMVVRIPIQDAERGDEHLGAQL